MQLILFILGVIGMTHIIVDGVILEPVHEWIRPRCEFIADLMDCYQCMGWWCGVLLAPILVSYNPFIIFACGCAGSFLAQLGWLLLDSLETYVKSNKKRTE